LKKLFFILAWFAFCFWPLAGWGEEGHSMYGAWIVVQDSERYIYEVKLSTITLGDIVVGYYRHPSVAEDIAEALNEAHEKRTHPSQNPRVRVTDSGTYPCCEDLHRGFICSMCDKDIP